MRPIPVEALLVIYVIALLGSYLKWRWALKGAGWTVRQKWTVGASLLAGFLVLIAIDVYYNQKLGFSQF